LSKLSPAKQTKIEPERTYYQIVEKELLGFNCKKPTRFSDRSCPIYIPTYFLSVVLIVVATRECDELRPAEWGKTNNIS
jgi:hypothetical protein